MENSTMRLSSAALFAVLLATVPAWASGPSPAGNWRTFDDKTGRERGLVHIDEANGVVTGRVVSTVDPAEAAHVCDKCDDDRRGKPLIGLEIIRGMQPDGEGWSGGRVLDPETGGIYRGKMHLEDGGSRLVLRGYLGISLFGRSQTWIRASP
jgi:uncharacterized protein (DUF2147 family)